MGRLHATPRTGCHSTLEDGFVQDGTQASTLDLLLRHLQDRAWIRTYVFKTLPFAAQANVRRRLFRCGLAASLDHTLRLAYSAQDGGNAHVATALLTATTRAALLVGLGLAPSQARLAYRHAGCGRDPAAGPGSHNTAANRTRTARRKHGHRERWRQQRGPWRGRWKQQREPWRGCGGSLGRAAGISKQQQQRGGAPPGTGVHGRAAVLTWELEAEAGPGAQGGGVRGLGPRDGHGRQQMVDWAADVMVCLYATATTLGDEVCWRAEAAQHAVAAAGNSDGVSCHQADAAAAAGCGDEVHEALARAARAACKLAAPLGWLMAADMAAVGGAAPQHAENQAMGVVAVGDMVSCLAHMCRSIPLLPPQQLLACQPHRLQAAACALGAHACCGPGAQRVGTPSDDGGDEGDPCAGCLVAPLQCFVRHALSLATPNVVMQLLALLKIAAGEVIPKAGVRRCEGGGEVTGEADGGFRQCAVAMADSWCRGFDDPSVEGLKDVVLPDGSDIGRLLAEQRDAGGRLPPPPPLPLLPSGVLPPPLALPPSRAGALLRLRMCGNPRCGNFAMEFEVALKLKFCKAVRYCGADCQRAHWREGHRAECKELAAGATGVTVAGL